MGHAPIAHVCNVEQAVHSAEVDEGTEIGNILDDAGPNLTYFQLFHQGIALGGAFRLENYPARHHDIPAALIELDDFEIVGLAE